MSLLLFALPVHAEDKVKPSSVAITVEQMRGFSMRFRPSSRSDGRPDPEAIKRDDIVKALRSGGTASVQALAKELSSKDLSMRKNASFVLSELGGAYGGQKMDIKAAIPALIAAAAGDSDLEVRIWSMGALATQGAAAKDAIPTLKKATRDKDACIGNCAREALSKLGAK